MDFLGFVSPKTRTFRLVDGLTLEGGEHLEEVEVAYRTWGEHNGSNAVLVCHALTGSADADDWWKPLFGPGRTLDPERDFIVCSNILGSCYGTTGPASPHPEGGRCWGVDFPKLTVRDMVRVQAALLDGLGVERLALVLGGSLGGMQVLEWALLYPERSGAIAPIACSGRHSAWCIGLSAGQRHAIRADPLWQGGRYDPERPPAAGLATARMIAMCTYRSRASFETRFARQRQGNAFTVTEYLERQGERLVRRFDANTYIALTEAMDVHDLGAGRASYEEALASVQVPALVVAIDSDLLYPPEEQEELAHLLPGGELAWLSSPHGHDAFLLDGEQLDGLLVNFRDRQGRQAPPRAIGLA